MKSKNKVSGFFDRIKLNPPISSNENSFETIVGKHIRKIIYIGSLVGTTLFLSGCAAGYVATEPTYSEYSRPQRPSDLHVWIDGDWVYNRSTRVYVQRNGYWERPQQNRVYISGQWQTTPRGKYWAKGHWQKNGRQHNRHSRD